VGREFADVLKKEIDKILLKKNDTLIDIVEVVKTLSMKKEDRGETDARVDHTNQASGIALTLERVLEAMHLIRDSQGATSQSGTGKTVRSGTTMLTPAKASNTEASMPVA
jgi:hypothetical protein